MKINEVVCIYELKKLELIREEKQQLNEFFPLIAAIPWLVGAGMTTYDYLALSKKEDSWDPSTWSRASQAEIVGSTAGTVAGGFLGRALGKGLGWAAGKVARGATGAVAGASKAATAKGAAIAKKYIAGKPKYDLPKASGPSGPSVAYPRSATSGGVGGAADAMAAGPKLRAFRGGKYIGKDKTFVPWTQRTGGGIVGGYGAVAGGELAGSEAGGQLGLLGSQEAGYGAAPGWAKKTYPGVFGADDKKKDKVAPKAAPKKSAPFQPEKHKPSWFQQHQEKYKTGTSQAISPDMKPIPTKPGEVPAWRKDPPK